MRINGEIIWIKYFLNPENDGIASTFFIIRLGFKGMVVNLTLLSLHGGSLEITLIDLLMSKST